MGLTSAHHFNRGSIPDLNPPSTDSDFYFVQLGLRDNRQGKRRGPTRRAIQPARPFSTAIANLITAEQGRSRL
jgi:hypothetical protein